MPKYILLLLIASFFAGCHRRHAEIKTAEIFTMPTVIYNAGNDSIQPFSVDSVDGVYPKFIGKYKFTDELNFGDTLIKRDTSILKDFIGNYWSGFKGSDTITTDGFQIFADYKTSIKFAGNDYLDRGVYYPVYIVNETKRTKLFTGKDRHAFAIQEARDTASYRFPWKPIESEGFDFCGNGYFGLKVHPGEFVMFLAKKYAGPDTTLMRIRVKVEDHIYISQPFKGSLSLKQFRVGQDESNSHYYLNVYYRYYGALPKNEEEERKFTY